MRLRFIKLVSTPGTGLQVLFCIDTLINVVYLTGRNSRTGSHKVLHRKVANSARTWLLLHLFYAHAILCANYHSHCGVHASVHQTSHPNASSHLDNATTKTSNQTTTPSTEDQHAFDFNRLDFLHIMATLECSKYCRRSLLHHFLSG